MAQGARIIVDVKNVPEMVDSVMRDVRTHVVTVLRAIADDETELRVAQRLREIATSFDVALRVTK